MEQTHNLIDDLGKYVEILIRQWQLIVSITLVCVIGAGLISGIQPKHYSTSALVSTTRLAYSVSFDSKIETLSEEDMLVNQGSPSYRLYDPAARMQSYVELVNDPWIANRVWEKLKENNTSESELGISGLMNSVRGEIAGKSDMIRITASASDPVLAATIANLWAQVYVDEVNKTYSDGGAYESYLGVKRQAEEAKKTYKQTQEALEAFVAQNKSEALDRQIGEQQLMLKNLVDLRGGVYTSVINQQSRLITGSFEQSTQDLENKLKQLYQDRQRVRQFLVAADDMRTQVEKGGDGAAASNVIALNLLKAQVFASVVPLESLQIQTVPMETTAQPMLEDLKSMHSVLEARRQILDEEIEKLSALLLANQDNSQAEALTKSVSDLSGIQSALDLDLSATALEAEIQELEQTIRSLQAQKESEGSHLKELTQDRDLAWETYLTLQTKEAERAVAVQTPGIQVSLAVDAVVPNKDDVSVRKNVSMAGIVGLLLGIFAAYMIEFWWMYKRINPYPVLNIHFARGNQREK